jgi:hypothetical protein
MTEGSIEGEADTVDGFGWLPGNWGTRRDVFIGTDPDGLGNIRLKRVDGPLRDCKMEPAFNQHNISIQ